MDCYPPCAACTGLCKTPVRAAPVSPIRKPRVEWHDRLTGRLLKCGHMVGEVPSTRGRGHVLDSRIPVAIVSMVKDVWCETCEDWQPLAKPRKTRKTKPVDPRQERIPY